MAESPPPQAALHNELVLVGFGDRDAVWPFGVGLILALFLHASIGASTTAAPIKKMSERVEMAIVRPPPPPPPPEPPPPPKEEKPPPPKKELPPPPEPPPPPPNQEPPPTPPEPVPIVTGISMASTVQGSSGMAVRVGNTTFGDPNKEKFVDPKDVKPYSGGSTDFKAARASTITREARILQDFKGPYPRDLVEEGVEGAVILLVEVDKSGAIRSVRLAKSCGNATLDKLAQDYMKRFRIAAAEVNGEKVDSVLRYTYRFELYD